MNDLNVRPRRYPRTRIESWSAGRLANLRAAVSAAQQDGRYAAVASIPALPQLDDRQQANLLFLPWNRAHLLRFRSLLVRDQANLDVPVWDWIEGNRRAIPAAFAHPRIDRTVNPLAASPLDRRALGAAELPFDGAATTQRRTREAAPKSSLPTPTLVERALACTTYAELSRSLEYLSNAVHVWVGGHMSLVLYAPFDPLFWAHRATIDRLWWLWQLDNPGVPIPPGIEHKGLWPFPQTVSDVWDPLQLDYSYPALKLGARRHRPFLGVGNDAPAEHDALGFRHYAATFAEVIASKETRPPLTIGIFGSWGIGKSTLLRQIVHEIEQQQGEMTSAAVVVHILEFNAWDYGTEEAIWPALVRAAMDQIARNIPWPWHRRVRVLFARNLRREWKRNSARIAATAILLAGCATLAVAKLGADASAVGAVVATLGLGGVLKIASDTVTNPAGTWVTSLFQDSDYGRRLGHMQAIRDDLDFLDERLQTESGVEHRILVVIDDLDRCEPAKVVEVLQAINRLLDRSSFIVCMGIDARIVTAAIQGHYAGSIEHAGASGYEYLDKIVQIPFRIPEPDDAGMDGLVTAQIEIADPAAPAEGDPFAGRVGRRLPLHDTGTPLGPPLRTRGFEEFTVPESDLDIPGMSLGERVSFRPEELAGFRELRGFLRPNPRHAKRIINVYRLVRTLAESKLREAGERADARLLLDHPRATIAWLILSAQWPYTARILVDAGRAFDRSRREEDRPPSLRALLASIPPEALRDGQSAYDDSLVRLMELLDATQLSWQEIRVICDYTVNFNPAVDEELERLRRTTERLVTGAGSRTSG